MGPSHKRRSKDECIIGKGTVSLAHLLTTCSIPHSTICPYSPFPSDNPLSSLPHTTSRPVARSHPSLTPPLPLPTHPRTPGPGVPAPAGAQRGGAGGAAAHRQVLHAHARRQVRRGQGPD